MRILFSASEVYPFSKTGGLADIASFLPKSIKQLGHDIKVITPLYKSVSIDFHKVTYLGTSNILMGPLEKSVNFLSYNHEGLEFIFVQNQEYFERDNLYGYDDDHLRFLLFSYATLEVLRHISFMPDIIHLNDWQTGMVPYLLDEHYRYKIDGYEYLHTLFTIHNLEYQGSFEASHYHYFNTDFNYTYIHFERINYLKAALERATMLNTVSPNYKNETLTQTYGFSLDGALSKRANDYVGILNGIDEDVFNPQKDPFIYKNYSRFNYLKGKKENKVHLLKKYGFSNEAYDKPVISYIGRLANQKGIGILSQILEELIFYSDAIIFLLGSGQKEYEDYFIGLSHKYPNRVACYIGYNEQEAHQIYASSDLFVMPSYFEPCGLGQMISMKYATLPIVRETGGLYDTVKPYNKYTKEGNGFTFSRYDAFDLKDKIFEALNLYYSNYTDFKRMMRQALASDFSIKTMALSYEKLYEKILRGR